MAALVVDDFSSWLSTALQELNIDETIFGSYIQSILESDETTEEQIDALREILSEIITEEDQIVKFYSEILEKWQQNKPKETPPVPHSTEDVDAKLVKLMESQSLVTTKQKKYTEEEKKLREAILTQYSQMSDDEADEDSAVPSTTDHKENGLEKNTNAQSVMQAEKVKREQAKVDSQKKKDKDKEDREKQKQLREEKKEKRKTQKGERRR